MKPADELTLKVAALATRSYVEWQEFLVAFTNYVTSKKDECIAAPVETVQVAQGRAQMCASLEDLFKGAVASASRITQRAGQKP